MSAQRELTSFSTYSSRHSREPLVLDSEGCAVPSSPSRNVRISRSSSRASGGGHRRAHCSSRSMDSELQEPSSSQAMMACIAIVATMSGLYGWGSMAESANHNWQQVNCTVAPSVLPSPDVRILNSQVSGIHCSCVCHQNISIDGQGDERYFHMTDACIEHDVCKFGCSKPWVQEDPTKSCYAEIVYGKIQQIARQPSDPTSNAHGEAALAVSAFSFCLLCIIWLQRSKMLQNYCASREDMSRHGELL
mmetsp:Transcript_46607/g.110836  ORF Transcript_46607/g.110836 Transcript_46607/m.110836 type:complete len:248 (-) Transcript_46607:3-746(-)